MNSLRTLTLLTILVAAPLAMASPSPLPLSDLSGNWQGTCGIGGRAPFPFQVAIKYNRFTNTVTYINVAYPLDSVGIQGDSLGTTTSSAGWNDSQSTLVLTKAEVWTSIGPGRFAEAATVQKAELSLSGGKLTIRTLYRDTYKRTGSVLVCEYEKK